VKVLQGEKQKTTAQRVEPREVHESTEPRLDRASKKRVYSSEADGINSSPLSRYHKKNRKKTGEEK